MTNSGEITWRTAARHLAAAGLLACLASPGALAQDIGHEGPSYGGANAWPSGTKPQSKLWFADGNWWGCLWSANAQSFLIERLDTSTETWVETSTAVDNRRQSHADCLWDGAKLYIASHYFTNGGAGADGHALLIYRYSYAPNTDVYSLDTGFPVQIADTSTETLVIDKDSTGTVWAVWMNDLRVWVAHTLADDRTWSTPVIHPECTTDVNSDDICSVVHFQGNRIGVLWSDQESDAYLFSSHLDGNSDAIWSSPEAVLSGPDQADDHLNLKASSDGRVFAALKTGTDEIRLLVRSTAGTWTSHLVASETDGWTRAIVLLDEEAREVHCFATLPILGGTIHAKVTSMDALSFPGGIGTPVIRDANDPNSLNDASSTKQNLSGATGLVVLASHQPSQRYWHHHDALGGAQSAPPLAAFFADPHQGYAELPVQFIDASSGIPTSWSWTFGDGGTSTLRHPQHTYSNPGAYTVSLLVANTLGSDSEQKTGLIQVDAPPTALVLGALEDSQVRELSPSTNYGTSSSLRVRDDPSSDYHAYLKFFVPQTGNQISSAKLRLFVTDASPDGGMVRMVPSTWNESLITWNNAPALQGNPPGSLGSVTLNTWAELDVTSVVTGGGLFSFGIANASTNSAIYSSREGLNPPQLMLALSPPSLPLAAFTANETFGAPPLTVQFFDTSGGSPSSWFWTFGDGATSTQQNPAHVYQRPALYTVSLKVTNDNGMNTKTVPDFIRVIQHAGVASSASLGSGGGVLVPLQAGTTGPGGVRTRDGAALVDLHRALPRLPLPEQTRALAVIESGELRAEFTLPCEMEEACEFYDQELGSLGALQRSVQRHGDLVLGVTFQLQSGHGTGSLELCPDGPRSTRVSVSWSR